MLSYNYTNIKMPSKLQKLASYNINDSDFVILIIINVLISVITRRVNKIDN